MKIDLDRQLSAFELAFSVLFHHASFAHLIDSGSVFKEGVTLGKCHFQWVCGRAEKRGVTPFDSLAFVMQVWG